tara:strand:- start:932 stop:1270 length:339 start_codon:yes stop_codon:yes gene_type:complete
MDYKTKYLKYKLKYLNAKKIYGGMEGDAEEEVAEEEVVEEVEDADEEVEEEGAENDDGVGFINIIQPIQQQQQQQQQIQAQPNLPQFVNHILGFLLQMNNQITTRMRRRRRK